MSATNETVSKTPNRRVILGGIVGNVMEWYDFAIYGYFATVIGKLFFPSEDPSVSLVAAFGAFAAGFLARPVGGLLLGRLGDTIGRSQVLMISIFAMALPTVLIGVLPSYEHMGVMAPIFIVLLRIIQGLSVGGEYTSSIVFLVEHAPKGKRGFMGSWSGFGAVSGILLGSAVGALFTNILTDDQIIAWGWRVPFLLGGAVAVIGMILRRNLSDAGPVTETKSPVTTLFRDHYRDVVRVAGLNLAMAGVGFYLIFVYSVTYIKLIDKLADDIAFDLNTANMVFLLLIIPASACLSDRFGRKVILGTGLFGVLVCAIPAFMLIHSTDPTNIFFGQLIFGVFIGIFLGAYGAANVEQFQREVRCTGLAVAYNLAVGIFGGTTPLIATWLIRETGDPISPAYYLMACVGVSIVALFFVKETAHKPLS
jgi:MHS family proline/betaine transporter-like MFS transporter